MSKVYVAVRFKGIENKEEVEELCRTVAQSGHEDFCFVRDIENYQHTFDDPKELWHRARVEIDACDVFLIDVSDQPSGGRVVEAGIAYALDKPIITIVKKGTVYKGYYSGISTAIVEYTDYADLRVQLMQVVL